MAGFDIQWVLQLDILAFDSLIGSIYRIQSHEKFEEANIMRAATQADKNDFSKFMKPYLEGSCSGTDRPKPGTKTAQDFIRAHGRGI